MMYVDIGKIGFTIVIIATLTIFLIFFECLEMYGVGMGLQKLDTTIILKHWCEPEKCKPIHERNDPGRGGD